MCSALTITQRLCPVWARLSRLKSWLQAEDPVTKRCQELVTTHRQCVPELAVSCCSAHSSAVALGQGTVPPWTTLPTRVAWSSGCPQSMPCLPPRPTLTLAVGSR